MKLNVAISQLHSNLWILRFSTLSSARLGALCTEGLGTTSLFYVFCKCCPIPLNPSLLYAYNIDIMDTNWGSTSTLSVTWLFVRHTIPPSPYHILLASEWEVAMNTHHLALNISSLFQILSRSFGKTKSGMENLSSRLCINFHFQIFPSSYVANCLARGSQILVHTT